MCYSIWQSILDGKLKPGTKIREEVVGDIFGVSRTLVRKVLYILEQTGIVTLPPNHGAFVASPTLKETHDLVEAMKLLALHVIKTLQREDGITPSQLVLVNQHIASQEEAEVQGDFRKARRLSAEFQILLAVQAANSALTPLYEKLAARLLIALSVHQNEQYQVPRADFQKRLIEQIKDRDTVGASESIDFLFNSIQRALFEDHELDEVDLYSILTVKKLYPFLGVNGAIRENNTVGTKKPRNNTPPHRINITRKKQISK